MPSSPEETEISEDELIARVNQLSVEDPVPSTPRKTMNPASFFLSQSARLAATAGKTRTKMRSAIPINLFADLLGKDAVAGERVDGKGKENEGILIERGPMMREKTTTKMNPYQRKDLIMVPHNEKEVIDYTSYSANGMEYECGITEWQDLHSDGGRSSVITTVGTPMIGTLSVPRFSSEEGKGRTISQRLRQKSDEAILSYLQSEYKLQVLDPWEEHLNGICIHTKAVPAQETQSSIPISDCSSFVIPRHRPAKEKIEQLVGEEVIAREMASLSAKQHDWLRSFPNDSAEMRSLRLLYARDAHDRTLLHHRIQKKEEYDDLAELFVIVEQQLMQPRHLFVFGLPWDTKNKDGETALWWAVFKRKTMFVDYLLELGADPNVSIRGLRQGSALHWAAVRGHTKIVESLVGDRRCNLDVEDNSQDTPLIVAVLYNTLLDEETKVARDNLDTAEILLRARADPTKTDKRGSNIFHLAASKCDTPMIEMFVRVIPDEIARKLANAFNLDGFRPIDYLGMHQDKLDSYRYAKCFYALLTCSGEVREERSEIEYQLVEEEESVGVMSASQERRSSAASEE